MLDSADGLQVKELLELSQEALDRDVAEWREWWGELSELGTPHFGEMGARLAAFREKLVQRFTHEARLELTADDSRLTPDVEVQAKRLVQQHPKLLRKLDDLINRLRCCEPAFDSWGAARDEFESFLSLLNDHESDVADLVRVRW